MAMPTDAQKKQIHDEIFAKTERALKSAGFSRSKIARELFKIAFSDIQDYVKVDENGKILALPLNTLKKGSSGAIKKVREKSKALGADGLILENILEFELYDKLDALKTVAAMLGMEKPKEIKHLGEIEHTHRHAVTPEIKEILDTFLGAGRET
ncbi:MAG: terminase small subunit [Syntrophaceae bacterium]